MMTAPVDFLICAQEEIAEHGSQYFLKTFLKTFGDHTAAQFANKAEERIVHTVQHIGNKLTGTAQFADTAQHLTEDSLRCTDHRGVYSGLILIEAIVQCLLRM